MPPVGVEAVLGLESREGPAEDHGDVERLWVWMRGRGVRWKVGCRVQLSWEDGGRRVSRWDMVVDAISGSESPVEPRAWRATSIDATGV